MSVSFNSVPVDSLIPYVYVEFDSSRAMSRIQGVQPFKALLVGPRLTGTKPQHELVPIRTADEASEAFGAGSILAHMAAAFFRNNRDNECVAIGIDDPPQATKARGGILVAGEPTAAGVLAFLIGGRRYLVSVSARQALVTIHENLGQIVNADPLRLVEVASTDDAPGVSFTARHGGEIGNAIDIRVSQFPGDALPPGLSVAVTAMLGGTLAPDLAPVITAMGDTAYNVIALPFTDATSLDKIEAELADRWGPHRPIDGHAFVASALATATLSTTFKTRNSPHLTIVAATDSPTPPWEWAAAVAGVNAREAQVDPARPYQTLPLKGVVPPQKPVALKSRDVLLRDGIATTTVDQGGVVRIERLVTTYKMNASGAPDASYRDITTKQTLSFLRWDFRTHFLTKFPRHKLADDGTRFGAGQPVLTPKTAKAEAIAKFSQWEDRGLVENADQFKRELVVERNKQNPNRLDFMLPPDLMNQLMVTAAQISFGV